jgi:hypothetical protein
MWVSGEYIVPVVIKVSTGRYRAGTDLIFIMLEDAGGGTGATLEPEPRLQFNHPTGKTVSCNTKPWIVR